MVSSLMLSSCDKQQNTFTSSDRKYIDSIVKNARTLDALAQLKQRFDEEGNHLGSIVTLREWGKILRNESRFDEALHVHSEGLQLAESITDTIEWIQALNNIGTDYRRMGILDIAQEYHYRANILSEEHSDTTFITKKNRVVALNGLGNIYLTLGNYDLADSVLRLALKGEKLLGSAIGQAINYANLGAIYEHNGQIDSAWTYYRHSMEFNREVNNQLGVSLCHTYFGSLYEQAQDYKQATLEYEQAYALMNTSKDEWHALNPLIALAGIYHKMNDDAKTMEYLTKARETAERIKSKEHLAEIHSLYYKFYKDQGNDKAALLAYETFSRLRDSVINIEKLNRIQNISLNIERNRQIRQVNDAELRLERERVARYTSYVVSGLAILLLVGIITMLLYTQRVRSRSHKALKQMSSIRENFFTNITHEFRTPLTIILGMSHDLQRGGVATSDIKECAGMIERQGNSLLRLINQLLDISKIKSAVGDPDWCSGDITAYIAMIIESYRDYARGRNINLQYLPQGNIEMDFVPDYVNKMMNNLLFNALKYTPEYGTINVILWSEDDNLCIDVADTGQGMTHEMLTRVFEPFYQARQDGEHIGSGVGLALVKQIVDAIDGKITVDSSIGMGSTFHIRIPIHQSNKPQLEEMNNTALLPDETPTLDDTKAGDTHSILIIEDNRDIAAYIGSHLCGTYNIAYATNGRQGCEKALEMVPDLIITDLMMPELNGLEVCKLVRSNEIINHIPIIVVTAMVTNEEKMKVFSAGADAYLSKPFNSQELCIRVKKLLDGRKLLRERYAQVIIESDDKNPSALEEQININSSANNKADYIFLDKVINVVHTHLNKHKEVDITKVASALCMSNSQFYRKIKALTGCTPTAYIQRVKIKNAVKLLDESPQMVFLEVATRSGFYDYSSFVRTFKNILGITPTEYQKRKAPLQSMSSASDQ